MGNGEWGMGDKKEKFPSSSLSLRLHPLSQLPTPHSQLPTPYSPLPSLQRTIKRQGAVTVDFLATDFEGGKQGGCKLVGTVLYC